MDNQRLLAHIQPYRTLDNMIDGVVLTFTDITTRYKVVETQQALFLAESIVNPSVSPLIVLDSAVTIISASRSFYQAFQMVPEQTEGRSIFELGNREWDIPAVCELLNNILPGDLPFDNYVEAGFPGIGRRQMLLNARRIVSKTSDSQLILLTIEVVV